MFIRNLFQSISLNSLTSKLRHHSLPITQFAIKNEHEINQRGKDTLWFSRHFHFQKWATRACVVDLTSRLFAGLSLISPRKCFNGMRRPFMRERTLHRVLRSRSRSCGGHFAADLFRRQGSYKVERNTEWRNLEGPWDLFNLNRLWRTYVNSRTIRLGIRYSIAIKICMVCM